MSLRRCRMWPNGVILSEMKEIGQLGSLLEGFAEVRLAYLFGSVASGHRADRKRHRYRHFAAKPERSRDPRENQRGHRTGLRAHSRSRRPGARAAASCTRDHSHGEAHPLPRRGRAGPFRYPHRSSVPRHRSSSKGATRIPARPRGGATRHSALRLLVRSSFKSDKPSDVCVLGCRSPSSSSSKSCNYSGLSNEGFRLRRKHSSTQGITFWPRRFKNRSTNTERSRSGLPSHGVLSGAARKPSGISQRTRARLRGDRPAEGARGAFSPRRFRRVRCRRRAVAGKNGAVTHPFRLEGYRCVERRDRGEPREDGEHERETHVRLLRLDALDVGHHGTATLV